MPKQYLYLVLLLAFLVSYSETSADKSMLINGSSFNRLSYSQDWEMKKQAEVRAVQQRLTELGYECGTADGVWGPGTEQALKEFQQDNKLTVDGIVGPTTRKALNLH